MKVLDIDYAKGVIDHEAVILGENIYWETGVEVPMVVLREEMTNILIIQN